MKMSIRLWSALAALIFITSAQSVRAEEASSSIPVHLTIIASSTQLFDGDLAVVACDSDGAGTMAFTGYCAVSQAEASTSWSWWGSDAFLDSINGVVNDNANGWYWGWFANLVYGETALNKYQLVSGDRILVLLNSAPLRLSASAVAPAIGDTVMLTVEEFGYDASWNPVWNPSASSHLMVGALDVEANASGTYALAISSADQIALYARKDGNYVQSPLLTITPTVPAEAPALAPSGSSNEDTGRVASAVIEEPEFDLAKAVEFLLGFQSGNGSFGDSMYTDWATIALKAAAKDGSEEAQAGLEKARAYLIDRTLSDSASLTDNERRALALMSAGINPYTGTDVNYIQRIIDEFDGEQFGDSDLENDDIFALLVLAKAGYKADDEMIMKSVGFLLGRQDTSGAWIGVDLTAAAIQALRPLKSVEGVSGAISKAEEYLKAQQSSDGGFGNVYSLSWALQALGSALPGADEALAEEQQNDGGLREKSAADENRLWATAYAIPGALHRSWSELMSSYKKFVPEPENDTEDEKSEPIQVSEPEPVVAAIVSSPVSDTVEPQVAPSPIKDVDVSAPEDAELESEEVSIAPIENVPLVASAIEVVENTKMPIIPIGLVLLGVVAGFFAVRAL